LAVEIARFDSGFTSSGVIAYSGASSEILETGVDQTGWAVRFECYDANYLEAASPFTVSGLTIPAGTITSLAATDDTADRYQDIGGALHAIVPFTISCSNYPQMLSLWTNSPQYGRIMHGWFWVTAAGTVVRIGDQSTGTAIFPPTVAAETVTVYAAIGTYDGKIDPTTISGVASTTVSVSAPPAPGSRDATGAYIDQINYYPVGVGTSKVGWGSISVTLPLNDPNFWFATFGVTSGKMVGGVFTPGGQFGNGPVGVADWVSDSDHATYAERITGTNTILVHDNGGWPVPSDGNVVFRIILNIVSRRGGPEGTRTLQECWSSGPGVSTPGTNTFQDLICDGTKSQGSAAQLSGTVPSASTAGYSTIAGSASTAGYSTSAGSATSAGSVPGSGVTGTVTLGGGGTATTVAQVKDAGGTVVCWMGKYTVSSVDYYGIWAQNVWIGTGGIGPLGARIWLDLYGSGHFSGSIESDSTITSATSVSTVYINGSQDGVYCVATGGYAANYSANSANLSGGAGYGTTITAWSFSASLGVTHSTLTYNTLMVGGYSVINLSGQFVGNGVSCSSYGVTCYSATIGAGGCTVGGYAVLTSYSPSTAVTFSSVSASGGFSGGAFTGAGVSCGSYNVGGYSLSAGVGGISCNGYSVVNSSGQFVGNGVSCSSYGVTCYSVTVGAGGLSVSGSVSLSGTFSGTHSGTWSGSISPAGVSCPSYGVSCYSLTVGAGGLSVGGYSGSTNTITFTDSGGGYCKLNGSALRMEFNYGVFNGLI
jgi:hypothetical protein